MILSFWIFEQLWETKADTAEGWETERILFPAKKNILKVIVLCGLPQHLSWLTTQAVRKMIAEKLFHLKAKLLGFVAAAEVWLHLGPDPASPEPGQSPVKVNEA